MQSHLEIWLKPSFLRDLRVITPFSCGNCYICLFKVKTVKRYPRWWCGSHTFFSLHLLYKTCPNLSCWPESITVAKVIVACWSPYTRNASYSNGSHSFSSMENLLCPLTRVHPLYELGLPTCRAQRCKEGNINLLVGHKEWGSMIQFLLLLLGSWTHIFFPFGTQYHEVLIKRYK